MPRRVKTLAVGVALLALLVFAPAAFGGVFVPESGGSQNADDISTLYKITLYVSIVIFLIVEGTLIWSLVKFRARRHGPEPAQIRGNTPLEMGWTLGAALILVVLTVVTFVYLGDIKDPPASDPVAVASINQPDPPDGDSLNIVVNGQQYLWRYDYPGKPGELFSYYEMVVPTGVTVTLEVEASDVIHSWWIPELGGKVDGVPGHTNETWFKIEEPGTYEGQCAELCGEGHADMRAKVVAVSPEDYAAWADQQRADIKEAQEVLGEQREAREQEEGEV